MYREVDANVVWQYRVGLFDATTLSGKYVNVKNENDAAATQGAITTGLGVTIIRISVSYPDDILAAPLFTVVGWLVGQAPP